MANFFDDLRAFITEKGFGPFFCEFLPDAPDAVIAAFVYSSVPDGYGGLTRRVQVQVRDKTVAGAYSLATQLSHLLDSGPEEELINLTADRHLICRPIRSPTSFGRDAKKRPTYYFEFAACGEDKE